MITNQVILARLRAALGSRAAARDESGIALLAAILFMILMAGVSVVLVSVVLAQTVPSNIAQKSTKTIYAAQAGMQTALGIIRAAAALPDSTGHIYGDVTKLPCTLSGQVNAQADGITYSVTINYFTTDPTGNTVAWQSSNKLICSSTTGVVGQPTYATIVSQGLAAAIPGVGSLTAGNRYISAIYKFKVSNVNVVGGRIYDYNKGYCVEAVTATAGSLVRFVAAGSCTNDALELWTYDTDYKIKLSSTTAGGAAGLCITGPVNYGDATQNTMLQACKTRIDPLRWNQLWSWTGSDSWQGQNIVIASGYSGYCLSTGYSAGTALTGKYLQVASGCNGAFAPTSQVGAGAAGYTTHQMVNYQEFGRCADVTGEQINASYEISYPCKQDPTGTGAFLLWNHRWFYTEPTSPATALAGQQIYVYYLSNGASKYCLTTPTTGNGNYPVFASCSGSAAQNWTRVYNTGTYALSYLFLDTYGRCLAVDSTDLYSGLYSKVTVTTCNGSGAQKWNAPPTYTDSTVASYKEVSP